MEEKQQLTREQFIVFRLKNELADAHKMIAALHIRPGREGLGVEIFERRRNKMIHHYLTKYKENGKSYAESWIQADLLGECLCFCRKKIVI